MNSSYNTLVLSDVHIPFHDKTAYALMLYAVLNSPTVPITHIVINGDYADFHGVSSFKKNPGIQTFLKDELVAVRNHLIQLRELFGDIPITYLLGNHEDRYKRYITNVCPELYGCTSFESIMSVEAYDIDFIEYGPTQKFLIPGTDLYARHAPIGSGKNPASMTVHNSGCSTIFGHTHKMQEYDHHTLVDRKVHRGINGGCLCDITHPVMQYVMGPHQWTLGFVVIHSLKRGGWANSSVRIHRSDKYYELFYAGNKFSSVRTRD